MPIINRFADFHEEMTKWRRELHSNPEICYEEVWTSDYISKKLESFGIKTIRGMGKTGVVGVLEGSKPSNKKIGLRADMDALPMPEENDFSYKSKTPGKMHACGHDGHMTMLLGAAKYLSETRNFSGTVYFIFSPAEEGGAGAKAMMNDGLFQKCPVDNVWGMHNMPALEFGEFAVKTGTCMASVDHFEIKISGRGSHAAYPQGSIDPITASTQIVQGLQMIVSRKINPIDSAVVSVTMINGGTAFNVIPDSVSVCGTARTVLPETRELVMNEIEKISDMISKAHGCSFKIKWHGGYPPTVNHANESDKAASVASDVVGIEKVHRNQPPSMGAEDFAFMLEEKPGAYIWVGSKKNTNNRMLHNSGYDFNDEILPIGSSYWARLVETELSS